jgi:hypothetical protein
VGLSTQALLLVSVLTLAGALLGAALGHWKRGGVFIASGAVIGGLSMFLFAVGAALYGWMIAALGLVALVILIAYNLLFG